MQQAEIKIGQDSECARVCVLPDLMRAPCSSRGLVAFQETSKCVCGSPGTVPSSWESERLGERICGRKKMVVLLNELDPVGGGGDFLET